MIGLLGFLNTSFSAIGNANNVHSSVPGHENQEEKVIIEKNEKGLPQAGFFAVAVLGWDGHGWASH